MVRWGFFSAYGRELQLSLLPISAFVQREHLQTTVGMGQVLTQHHCPITVQHNAIEVQAQQNLAGFEHRGQVFHTDAGELTPLQAETLTVHRNPLEAVSTEDFEVSKLLRLEKKTP